MTMFVSVILCGQNADKMFIKYYMCAKLMIQMLNMNNNFINFHETLQFRVIESHM